MRVTVVCYAPTEKNFLMKRLSAGKHAFFRMNVDFKNRNSWKWDAIPWRHKEHQEHGDESLVHLPQSRGSMAKRWGVDRTPKWFASTHLLEVAYI